jgi:phosphotransferase system HPr-like phosphotransfer protein
MKKFNNIIKGFTKTINSLEKLEEKNKGRELIKTDLIKKLKGECITLEEEGKKALAVANKLKALLED